MASSLKDRIAALEQQGNAQRATSPPPVGRLSISNFERSSSGAGNASSLRDKIARFEKKGGVPVPRGSFGLGAPLSQEASGNVKKKGDLYGNRISTGKRMLSDGSTGVISTTSTRPTSPIGFSPSPSQPLTLPISDSGMTPDNHDKTVNVSEVLENVSARLNKAQPRGTEFSAALDMARKAELKSGLYRLPSSPENDPSFDPERVLDAKSPITASPQAEAPAIIVLGDDPAASARQGKDEVPEDTPAPESVPGTHIVTENAVDPVPTTSSPAVEQAVLAVPSPKPETLDGSKSSPDAIPTPASPKQAPIEIMASISAKKAKVASPVGASAAASKSLRRTSGTNSRPAAPSSSAVAPPTSAEQMMKPPPRSSSLSASSVERSQPEQTQPVLSAATSITAQAARPVTAPAPQPDSDDEPLAPPKPVMKGTVVTTKVTITRPKTSSSTHQAAPASLYVEPDLTAETTKQSGFSAVVHRRTSDASVTAVPVPIPSPAATARLRQGVKVEIPQSQGFGDLAALLEEAAVLELALERGQLPSEHAKKEAEEAKKRRIAEEEAAAAAAIAIAKAAEEERQRRAAEEAAAAAAAESAAQKSKHTFRNPLARNRNSHQRKPSNLALEHSRAHSAFFPDVRPLQTEPVDSPMLREQPFPMVKVEHARSNHRTSQSMASVASTVTATPSAEGTPSTPPPRSPLPRYFSSLRKLTGSRSSFAMPGAYPRYSVSTSSEISSEDSTPIITPPDHSLDFVGSGSLTEFGVRHQPYLSGGASRAGSVTSSIGGRSGRSGVAWPSLSSKQSGSSLTRAATFAEKFLSRDRTNSKTSNVSANDAAEPKQLELLPPIPSIPSTIFEILHDNASTPPSATTQSAAEATVTAVPNSEKVIVPPARSTSLRGSKYTNIKARQHTYDGGRIISSHVPPTGSGLGSAASTPAAAALNSPARGTSIDKGTRSSFGDLYTRPSSWNSWSSTSAGSSPLSPLFDKEIFDAFPAVPSALPPGPSKFPRRGTGGFQFLNAAPRFFNRQTSVPSSPLSNLYFSAAENVSVTQLAAHGPSQDGVLKKRE